MEPFETIDWATGQEPALVTRIKEDQKRMREAKEKVAELRSFSTRETRPSGKPLFATDKSQPSLFKKVQIPAFNVSNRCANNIVTMKMVLLIVAYRRRSEIPRHYLIKITKLSPS